MSKLPTMFVSHGAPTLAIDDGPAHEFLIACGKSLGKPRAILVLSAHFEAPTATVTTSLAPKTVYDFYGFPEALYNITYAAPGDPKLAHRVSELLSIDSRKGPAYHVRLGELLRPLREEGVLIIGSGGATHNLSHAIQARPNDPIEDWTVTFREWLADAVTNDRRDDLANYRDIAPAAVQNHPTEEHFLPLLCAMGATEPGEPRRRIHASNTYGSLAMDAYLFGAP